MNKLKRTWRSYLGLLLIFVVLGLSRWQLKDLQHHHRGASQAEDAPNSFFGSFVAGAFRPLFLEHLWAKADHLKAEGQYWELVDVYDRLARLDPQDERIWFHQCYQLTFGVARQEPSPAERWRWYRRVFRHLAKGLEYHPDSYRLKQLQFDIYFSHIAVDPYLDRQLKRTSGHRGLDHALRVADAMRRDFPDDEVAWHRYRIAAEETTEALMNKGQFGTAAGLFEELIKLDAEIQRHFPKGESFAFRAKTLGRWAKACRTLEAAVDWKTATVKDRPAIDALGAEIVELLQKNEEIVLDPEEETLDGAVIALIQVRITYLCHSAVLAKNHALALSYLDWLNTISILGDSRLGSERSCYSKAYVDSLKTLISLDQQMVERMQIRDQKWASLREVWLRQLKELDRLFRERSGRFETDHFTRRLLESRR